MNNKKLFKWRSLKKKQSHIITFSKKKKKKKKTSHNHHFVRTDGQTNGRANNISKLTSSLRFCKIIVNLEQFPICVFCNNAQRAHNVKSTLIQRWVNVLTLNQRWIDDVSTVCSCWDHCKIPYLSKYRTTVQADLCIHQPSVLCYSESWFVSVYTSNKYSFNYQTRLNTSRFLLQIGLLFVIFGNRHLEARVINCYKNGLCDNRMMLQLYTVCERAGWSTYRKASDVSRLGFQSWFRVSLM